MKQFFKKYVTRRIYNKLLGSGIKNQHLWHIKEETSIPKPRLLYKIVFVVAAELDLDRHELLYEAVNFITGDTDDLQ